MKKFLPRGKQNPLTDADRFMIIALHKGGSYVKEIAYILKKNPATVRKFIRKGWDASFFSWDNFRKYMIENNPITAKQAA